MVVPYNRIPEVGGDVACVVVEPVAANMGLVAPEAGFLEGLRRACDEAGALLVFDEVITGFRVAMGGATELTGVTPDLFSFGKVIGGGLPLAAFGGRQDVMRVLAPVGPVYQAGTLSGNPLATAAGLAVLELLNDESFSTLRARAASLALAPESACGRAVVAVQVPVASSLLGLFFAPETVVDYEGARAAASSGAYAAFFHEMLDRGVALAPGPYEIAFPSLAHTDADLARTAEAAEEAATVLAKAGLGLRG